MVSGKSRNIVLVKLRDFDKDNHDAPEEAAGDKSTDAEVTNKVCEFQNLAPFCLSKSPQMIIPILPNDKAAV